jgi:hypothetical protein
MSVLEQTINPTLSNAEPQPKRRAQRPMEKKFPHSMNFGVTQAMAEAIQELCTPQSPFTQSDVGRISLHSYLLVNSERYRRAIGGNSNGA